MFGSLQKKISAWLQSFSPIELIIFGLTLIFFLINSQYVSYPDEFVNLLGGLSILQGKIPYTHFFDHHLPLAWYLASILLIFSFKSYVVFRFLYALLVFFSLMGLGLWIKKTHKEIYYYYLIFFIIYPIFSVYFWIHLYLADSLAVFFFSLTFWILFVQTVSKKNNLLPIIISSLLTFCLVFSSLTYIYLALGFYCWQMLLILFNKKKIFFYCLFSLLPYLIYFLYLLISGSLKDFYFSNFQYNVNLYISIPNFTRGPLFNPLKFGLTLIYNFLDPYYISLNKIKELNLFFPLTSLAAISSLILLIFLFRQNPFIGLAFFFILAFSAPRSNISITNETDYQTALYFMLGIISSITSLFFLMKAGFKKLIFEDLRRVSQIYILINLFFLFVFFVKNTYGKFYQVYTQKMPHIYDKAQAQIFFDQMLNPGDYYWVGPYEPNEEFFVTKGQLPGKFPTLLPQFGENEEIRMAFLDQFEKNPPSIILFRHESSIFMNPADQFGKFFTDWMKGKYTAIQEIRNVKVKQSISYFKLPSDLYLENSKKEELLQQLRNFGYIE